MTPAILKHTKVAGEWNMGPLVNRLFQMEPRIRVFQFADDPMDFLNESFGYIPRKDCLLIPCVLPAAEHEIAHMVEMTDLRRLVLPDLGLASEMNSKVWKTSTGLPETMSVVISAAAREARVRAIQNHFFPEAKFTPMWKHSVWGEDVGKRLEKEPFGRLKSFKDYKDWINDIQTKTFVAWSPERIEHEWIRRLDYIRDWMES